MMPLLVIHFAVTWTLVGLIWTIQAVHYPLLKDVGHERFIAYHERHMALITRVVGPLMLVEVGSAALLLYLGEPSGGSNGAAHWVRQQPAKRSLRCEFEVR